MKKLSAAIVILVALTGTATAGWTHKVSIYSPSVNASTKGVANVRIETPSDYRISAETPPKVFATAPSGVTIERVARASRAVSKPDKTTAEFEIAFTAAKKGRYALQAEVDFAICTKQGCVPKTERLAFEVDVK